MGLSNSKNYLHERRLERLKGLRESMKKESKLGPKSDGKGVHIISLE